MTQEPLGWQEVRTVGSLIRVSLSEPVAVVRRSGVPEQVVTWPDLPVGWRSPVVRIEAAPNGAWVLYTPMEADESPGAEKGSATIYISPDGEVVRFPDLPTVRMVGATRHGLWLSVDDSDDDVDAPADWLVQRGLLVLAEDGQTSQLTIDRIPVIASDDGLNPRLLVYASAPEAIPDGDGGAWYKYRYLQLDLPPTDLPPTLSVAEHATMSLEEKQVPELMDEDGPPAFSYAPGEPRVSWKMVYLPLEQQQAAIKAVCAEFADVDFSRNPPGGSMEPIADGMTEAWVEVIGVWPETRVEVSFRHPHYARGRLRRTLRVFDDAGRVTPTQYAGVHLMEDVETGALPPVSRARDGILDI